MQTERKGKEPAKKAAITGRRLGQISNYLIWQPSICLSIIKTIQTIASRECSVSIVGETGTCKELAARQIHENSSRAENLFAPVHCAVVKGQLFESQLFGHVKGSFPAATSDTLGVFRSANKGTIFFNEMGELSSELQVKLVHVLQKSRVTPVGSAKSYPVDVRVICATRQNLKQMIRDGRLRADLYFHLNPVTLEIPPLRTRKEDIIIMAHYFLSILAQFHNQPPKTFSAETIKILSNYDWPGNVVELVNMVEQAYILSDSNVIKPSTLPTDILTKSILPKPEQTFPTFDHSQKELLIRALQETNGHKMAAAKLLGISYGRLSRLIKKYNLSTTYK